MKSPSEMTLRELVEWLEPRDNYTDDTDWSKEDRSVWDELQRLLPRLEAAADGMEAAHNHFLKDGTSSPDRFSYVPWAAALVAYRAARRARRGDAVD